MSVQNALNETSTVKFGTDGAGNDRWVWRGYARQEAASLVRSRSAQSSYPGAGAVVAIIDSGIDPDHPLFEGHTVPGYDFLLEQQGLSEAAAWDRAAR